MSEAVEKSVPSIPTEIEKILESFPLMAKETESNNLPSHMEVYQKIDLIPWSMLPNLPHYRMSPREVGILQDQVDKLLQEVLIKPTLVLVLYQLCCWQRKMGNLECVWTIEPQIELH